MYRIDGSSTVPTLPTPLPAGTGGFFTEGAAATGQEATIVTADWANTVQEEIANVVVQAGLTLSKTDNGQLLKAMRSLGRIKLLAPLDLYVATGGNDTNAGLSPAAPFKTLQRAVELVRVSYDCAAQPVNIHVADGVYTAGADVVGLGFASPARINFIGNPGNPAACKIAMTAPGQCFGVGMGGLVTVSGFALESTAGSTGALWTTPGIGLAAGGGGLMYFDHCAFGPCNFTHINVGWGGQITVPAAGTPYSIYGGAVGHMTVGSSGGIVSLIGSVCTISNPVTFSGRFAWADSSGLLFAPTMSFMNPGNVTGKRYDAVNGGFIITNGGGPNFFPGTIPGDSSGGYYN